MRLSYYSSTLAIPFIALLLLLSSLSIVSQFSEAQVTDNIFDGYRNWTRTQWLRDSGLSQNWYNFSDSVDIHYPFVAVGSTSVNQGKGSVKLYHNPGSGFQHVATITDPAGAYGDNFGSNLYFFERVGFLHIAVTAKDKAVDGCVIVYRLRSISTPRDWFLSEAIFPPEGESVTNFGRITRFDGDVLLISSEARYAFSNRFEIASINVPGTRDFIESSGIDPLPSDPVFAFRSLDGRGNSTAFTLVQTIRTGPYRYNFGISMDQDSDNLVVGASARIETLFGFGTDGDLVVSGVHLLDGTAEYNFNSVTILPGGTLTTDGYDPLRGRGGVLRINILDHLTIHEGGAINMTSHGFKGAPTRFSYTGIENGGGPGRGTSAESPFVGELSCQYDGTTVLTASLAVDFAAMTTYNESLNTSFAEACGGGASYSTKGTDGTLVQCGTSGIAGDVYGQQELLNGINHGSGGGSGQPWKVGSGGAGGTGGGQIIINTRILENNGTIETNGGRGEDGSFFSGGGGGGSGGSILIRGTSFLNNGQILALGGSGGYRSVDSGSGIGDGSVRGGDGGDGRIRIDFLTKFAATNVNGTISPDLYNITLWDGAVYWYKKQPIASGGLYDFVTELPRLPNMQFVGHSVAIRGNVTAIASDERSLSEPFQSVYIVDITGVVNSSSNYTRYREIYPPAGATTDKYFGYYQMKFDSNATSLLVSATGQNIGTRGVSYLFVGSDLFTATDRIDAFESIGDNSTNNEYSIGTRYQYPYVVVRNPTSHDTRTTQLERESQGTVIVYLHMSNISAAHSSIDCQYPAATQNTTVKCYIRAKDVLGRPTGDMHNLGDFEHPSYPNLQFDSIGVFSFTHTATHLGSDEVWASYLGERVNASFTLAVTKPFNPFFSNFSCVPYQVVPGQTITCYVMSHNGDGEESAAKDFDVIAYNTQDVELQVQAKDQNTQFGVFRPPRSKYITTNALEFDFPTMMPTMSWDRKGVYKFSFVPWRPGPYAAFVKYKNTALSFPNPVIIDALAPPVDGKDSLVECPSVWAPNRTIACTFQMSGAGGDGGDAGIVANFSRRVYATAFMNGKPQSVSPVWAGEGRISLLTFPAETGNLTFQVRWKDDIVKMFPADGVIISPSFATSCQRVSLLLQSFTLHNQVVKGYADEAVYGDFVQKASYIAGTGICDTPLL